MKDSIFLYYDSEYQKLFREYHEAIKARFADYNDPVLKQRQEDAWKAVQRRRQEVLEG